MEAASVALATSETPEQQSAYVKRESEKWREIVKLSGIKAE
jgi:tripartite-type tricarboxylate transporter receptor subunit TctC